MERVLIATDGSSAESGAIRPMAKGAIARPSPWPGTAARSRDRGDAEMPHVRDDSLPMLRRVGSVRLVRKEEK